MDTREQKQKQTKNMEQVIAQHASRFVCKLIGADADAGASSVSHLTKFIHQHSPDTDEKEKREGACGIAWMVDVTQLDAWIQCHHAFLLSLLFHHHASPVPCAACHDESNIKSMAACQRYTNNLENVLYPFFFDLHAELVTQQLLQQQQQQQQLKQSHVHEASVVCIEYPRRVQKEEEDMCQQHHNPFAIIKVAPLRYIGKMELSTHDTKQSFLMSFSSKHPFEPFQLKFSPKCQHPWVHAQVLCPRVLQKVWSSQSDVNVISILISLQTLLDAHAYDSVCAACTAHTVAKHA